jgi:hypothetical protein
MTALLPGHGPAWRVGGAQTGSLVRRDDGGWALTARQ